MSAAKFMIKKASNNIHHYWTLQAPNGEIIATSEMYLSKAGAQNGIQSVKLWAPTATIEDTTVASNMRRWG